MLSARAGIGRAKQRRSDSMVLCPRPPAGSESMRDQYVGIKMEKGCEPYGYGVKEVIDLADSGDERESQRRIAGRFDVQRIPRDDGSSVEMIEFLSDVESCADDEAEHSEAETFDLSPACDRTLTVPCAARNRPTFHVELPSPTVDLTDTRDPSDGLLHAYEQIYADLARSSSSDDYESSNSSDESGIDQDSGDDSDTTIPRALAFRRRSVKTAAPVVDKKVLQAKVFTDITNLEMSKPWRYVYRCLDIPFESTPRTDPCGFLFERWDDFWHDHGRAVWERMYWKPMPADCYEYKQRHNRQCRSAKAFRQLAEDLHSKYGVKLVELVKMVPHSGWWYRSKRPVDLVRLRRQDSRLYALHLSRFRERWPFGVRHVQVHGNSCWCLPEATDANGKGIEAVEVDDESLQDNGEPTAEMDEGGDDI